MPRAYIETLAYEVSRLHHHASSPTIQSNSNMKVTYEKLSSAITDNECIATENQNRLSRCHGKALAMIQGAKGVGSEGGVQPPIPSPAISTTWSTLKRKPLQYLTSIVVGQTADRWRIVIGNACSFAQGSQLLPQSLPCSQLFLPLLVPLYSVLHIRAGLRSCFNAFLRSLFRLLDHHLHKGASLFSFKQVAAYCEKLFGFCSGSYTPRALNDVRFSKVTRYTIPVSGSLYHEGACLQK